MPSQISTFDYDHIQQFAGLTVFSRGYEYFSSNRVEKVSESETTIHANVKGTQTYSVTITLEDGTLAYRCDCPQGDEGRFCKHCVATALAWMGPKKYLALGEPASTLDATPAAAHKDGIQTFLETQSKEDLVKLVQELAREQSPVVDKLRRLAAHAGGSDALLAILAGELEGAIRYPDDEQRDWQSNYSGEVGEVLDRISELLSPSNATQVAELCWKALPWLGNISKEADDSYGTFGYIASKLRDLHVRACRQAPPDIRGLAVRIYRAELKDDLALWNNWIEAHAGILKHEGLAVIRALVDAELAKLADKPEKIEEVTLRYFLRRLDAIPEVAKEGLTFDGEELQQAGDFEKAARKCREVGDRDRALDFALKGMTAGGLSYHSLKVFLVEEYFYRGWIDKALVGASALFREYQLLDSYIDCKRVLRETPEWPQWRANEIAALKARQGEHSVLVEILLSEGLLDDAWEEAKQNGCQSEVWLKLAGQLSPKHPEEASNIYFRHAKSIMGYGNHTYQAVVRNLVLAAAAARTAGIAEKFISEMNAFLTEYKSRRNLKALVSRYHTELYGD
jgi:hypothetical protein